MKKFAAFILAFALVLSLGITSFAADTGTITKKIRPIDLQNLLKTGFDVNTESSSFLQQLGSKPLYLPLVSNWLQNEFMLVVVYAL